MWMEMLVTTMGRDTAHGTDGTHFAVGVCCSPRVQGQEHLLLLQSLILKGGYMAGVGSNQVKLHFHSALHARPLKTLKKILETVQHKIALAHCSGKTNLLPGFENWKFTRLIAELPGPGMESGKDQGSLGCSAVMGMTFPSVLILFLVDYSVLPSHHLLLLTTRAVEYWISLFCNSNTVNLLWIFFFFPSLASANTILILEIVDLSWVPTCSTVSCLLMFWEGGCPPPQAVSRENVSFFCKAWCWM